MIFSNGLELSMETSLYNLNLGSAHTDRSTQGTVILIRLRVSTLKDNYIEEVKQCMRKRTTTTITSKKKKNNIFFKNTKNPPPPKKNKPPHKCTHKWKPLFLSAGSAPFVVKCLMFVLVYKCTYVKWKFKVD